LIAASFFLASVSEANCEFLDYCTRPRIATMSESGHQQTSGGSNVTSALAS
jgi:hypothetical protein